VPETFAPLLKNCSRSELTASTPLTLAVLLVVVVVPQVTEPPPVTVQAAHAFCGFAAISTANTPLVNAVPAIRRARRVNEPCELRAITIAAGPRPASVDFVIAPPL